MNLHRIEGSPEWQQVSPQKRNGWQKVAAATRGVVTIGNFFSLLGLLSVPAGLWLVLGRQAYLMGAAVFVLGRLCDVADGWLADRTGTKSPLGETVDATFDKVGTGATLIGLAAGGTVPLALISLFFVPHLTIALIVLAAYVLKRRTHPSQAGKLSTGFGWAFVIVAVVATGADHASAGDMVAAGLWVLAFVLAAISCILGAVALLGYARDFLEAK